MNNTDHISAKIILHSLNQETGAELVTFELEYPRYIHSELMTHRVFSRNAQSSRAIPVNKNIIAVSRSNWYPIFLFNRKGMAATDYITGDYLESVKDEWDFAKYDAISAAERLVELNVHKQIVNRILEPFSLIKVIVSATDLSNFFELRLAPGAQQEIQVLARKMKDALESSVPQRLSYREWHIPYISSDEMDLPLETRLKVSAARCARVSYLNHDGDREIDKDISLFNSLLSEKHMSPFEHQAYAEDEYLYFNNFYSFIQQRIYLKQKGH